MLTAKWSELYSVNIEEMDNQHKKLLNLMNYLDEAIKEGKEPGLIGIAVEEFNGCVEFHFREEEKLLESINYPHLVAHKNLHLHFLVQFQMMNSAYQSGHFDIVQIFVQYLKNWFVFHVFSEDRIYGAFLESRKAGTAIGQLKAGNY